MGEMCDLRTGYFVHRVHRSCVCAFRRALVRFVLEIRDRPPTAPDTPYFYWARAEVSLQRCAHVREISGGSKR
jgi:hypothetical protein